MSIERSEKPPDVANTVYNGATAIIDIDDVLADFPDAFLRYLMERTLKPWGLKYGQYGLEDAVMKHYGSEVGNSIISDFYSDRSKKYLANLKTIPGSVEYVKYLYASGYRLHFLTGRPARMFPDIAEDTACWLAKQGIQYDQITFTRRKGDFLKWGYNNDNEEISHKYNNVELVIEDNLDFAKQLAPYCEKVYLRNRHYNWPPGEGENKIIRFWEFEELY